MKNIFSVDHKGNFSKKKTYKQKYYQNSPQITNTISNMLFPQNLPKQLQNFSSLTPQKLSYSSFSFYLFLSSISIVFFCFNWVGLHDKQSIQKQIKIEITLKYSNIGMENIEKRKKQYLKSFIFTRIQNTMSIIPLYCLIVSFNIIFDGLIMLEYIVGANRYREFGIEFLFYLQAVMLCLTIIIAILGQACQIFKKVLPYYTLFLQSMSPIFIRNFYFSLSLNSPAAETSSSFYNELSIKICQIIIFVMFSLIIILIKNNMYYPYQYCAQIFSMRQQNISLWLLLFRIVVFGILQGIGNGNQICFKILIFSVFLFFWKSRNPGYLHLYAIKVWDIYFYFINWSLFIIFLSSYITLINDSPLMYLPISTPNSLTYQQIVFHLWIYTFPFVLMIPIFKFTRVSSRFWEQMFECSDHQLQKKYKKEQIYLLCDQLRQFVEDVKKSQFKYRDNRYKKLVRIVEEHSCLCTVLDCPFKQIGSSLAENKNGSGSGDISVRGESRIINQSMIVERDQYHEHRIYLKVLKCTLQYIRQTLLKLKQNYPNLLEVQLEIAHFYLIGLKNKQQGMILYNEYNTKKIKKSEKKDKEFQDQQQQSNTSEQEVKNNKNQVNGMQQPANRRGLEDEQNWDQQYSIYYIKKKIDNIFIGEQNQMTTNMNIDNQLSEFRQKIQVSVTMLVEFWSLLSDPKCNLKKMYDLANILFPLKTNIQENWEKIKKYKNIQIFNIYAKYLIKMFNDKENGVKIYQQAKKIDSQIRNKQEIVIDEKGECATQENGIIFMQFDGKNSGVMFQVNINAQKIFGYNKGQLLNRKVNDLMPTLYSTQHDKILENYQQTNQSTMMNKQRYVWGKSKDGYLFPFIILIKPILSFYSQSSSSQVYANIKKQVYLKQIVGIVVDLEDNVREFSSSALRVFTVLEQRSQSMKNSGYGNQIQQSKHSQSQKPPNKTTQPSIKITELIPNFHQLKQKILLQNEQCEIKLQRMVKQTRHSDSIKFMEKCTYSINCTEINIKICGKIGYIVKLSKIGNSQFSEYFQGSRNENLNGSFKVKKADSGLLEIASQGQNVGKDKANRVKFQVSEDEEQICKNFIFSYDMSEKLKNFSDSIKKVESMSQSRPLNLLKSQKKFKKMQQSSTLPPELDQSSQHYTISFVGGFTHSSELFLKIKTQTLSTFKAQLKVTEQQYQQNRIDYSIGIKTKRLQDNVVREMRQEEGDLEYKKQGSGQQNKQQASCRPFTQIKPSQMYQISSSSTKNTQIRNMRMLTILLLVLCSMLCILQYILEIKKQQEYNSQLDKIKELSEIRTEIMNINLYVNYLTHFQQQELLSYQKFQDSVNLLDDYSNAFMFSTDTLLKYSDGSYEHYYLGFAINKLISEANSLRMQEDTLLFDSQDPSTFFIRYNTVNGLCLALQKQHELIIQKVQSLQRSLQALPIQFLLSAISLTFLLLVVKNMLLKCVMNRKTEILQIFFEIPRASCSRIQKECEMFILQLTATNQEEQMEFISSNQGDEFEGFGGRDAKVHKKRVAVGEENTAMQFAMVSLAFLLFLLSFQLFTIVKNISLSSQTQTLKQGSTIFYTLQYKLAEIAIFLQSYKTDQKIPIKQQSQQLGLLQQSKNQLIQMVKNSRKKYYDLENIFDDDTDTEMNNLYYGELCKTDCQPLQNSTSLSSTSIQGLNSLLAKYIQILKMHIKQVEENSYTIKEESFRAVNRYMQLMRINWRKLTQLIQVSQKSYLKSNQASTLFVLVGICIVNMVLVLGAWMWYYWRLQDKIMATQYILGFIPIDEINKNGKIAEYIRKQLIDRKM